MGYHNMVQGDLDALNASCRSLTARAAARRTFRDAARAARKHFLTGRLDHAAAALERLLAATEREARWAERAARRAQRLNRARDDRIARNRLRALTRLRRLAGACLTGIRVLRR